MNYEIKTEEYFDKVLDWTDVKKLQRTSLGNAHDDGEEVIDECWDGSDKNCILPIEELPLSATFIASQQWISIKSFDKYKKGAAGDDVFPPILVVDTPEGYLVRNGHHRLCVHRETKREYIRAYVARKENMPA